MKFKNVKKQKIKATSSNVFTNLQKHEKKTVLLEKWSILQRASYNGASYRELPKDTSFLAAIGSATSRFYELTDTFLRNYPNTQLKFLSDFDLGGLRFS